MKSKTNSEDSRCRKWSWLALGLFGGAVLAAVPMGLFPPIAVLAGLTLGLFIRERRLILASLTAAAVMVGALFVPVKHEDRRVPRLASTNLTVADLVATRLAFEPRQPEWNSFVVRLVSATPTRREILASIQEQTPLIGFYRQCGTTWSCLFGGGGGLINLKLRSLSDEDGTGR